VSEDIKFEKDTRVELFISYDRPREGFRAAWLVVVEGRKWWQFWRSRAVYASVFTEKKKGQP
jgi:hypothetical protein